MFREYLLTSTAICGTLWDLRLEQVKLLAWRMRHAQEGL